MIPRLLGRLMESVSSMPPSADRTTPPVSCRDGRIRSFAVVGVGVGTLVRAIGSTGMASVVLTGATTTSAVFSDTVPSSCDVQCPTGFTSDGAVKDTGDAGSVRDRDATDSGAATGSGAGRNDHDDVAIGVGSALTTTGVGSTTGFEGVCVYPGNASVAGDSDDTYVGPNSATGVISVSAELETSGRAVSANIDGAGGRIGTAGAYAGADVVGGSASGTGGGTIDIGVGLIEIPVSGADG